MNCEQLKIENKRLKDELKKLKERPTVFTTISEQEIPKAIENAMAWDVINANVPKIVMYLDGVYLTLDYNEVISRKGLTDLIERFIIAEYDSDVSEHYEQNYYVNYHLATKADVVDKNIWIIKPMGDETYKIFNVSISEDHELIMIED